MGEAHAATTPPVPAAPEVVSTCIAWRLTAMVSANAVSSNPICLTWDPYRVLLHCDEDCFLSEIRVEKRVEDIPENEPQIVVYKEKPPARATVNLKRTASDANQHVQDLFDLLQYFESVAGYLYQIDWVDWREPRMECFRVSPSGEETQLLSWDIHSESGLPAHQIDPVQLMELFVARQKFDHLKIPLAFIREGRNDLEAERNINAFFSFYFFLEGLYGNGKWRSRAVKAEFKKSRHVRDAATAVMSHFDEPEFEQHLLNLREFLEADGLEYTVDGVIDLLVNLRGNLHHFSVSNSTAVVGHPLNHATFRTPALLTMSICCEICTALFRGETPC